MNLTDLLCVLRFFFPQVWVKPPWSRKPVKLCRPQEWEWKGFTPRRSERGAGEWALMSSRWRGREASCPESGSRGFSVSPTKQPACLHRLVLTPLPPVCLAEEALLDLTAHTQWDHMRLTCLHLNVWPSPSSET